MNTEEISMETLARLAKNMIEAESASIDIQPASLELKN